MIFVKGGTFQMGDSVGDLHDACRPVHSVTVSDFYIGKYEVTFDEYDKFCEATNSKKPDDEEWGRGKRPVINVSWNGATAYCEWLSKKTGQTYRLPTEAEWEYAAGGGANNRTKYAGTDNENELRKYAWFDKNAGGKTHEVGTREANQLGIYDMSGNVWEWCVDWYSKDYYKNSPKNNPNGATSGSGRVLRGGSWDFNAVLSRIADRNSNSPVIKWSRNGFRIVFSL